MRCTGKRWLLAATATLGVVEAGKTKSVIDLSSARRVDCGLGLLDLILWREDRDFAGERRVLADDDASFWLHTAVAAYSSTDLIRSGNLRRVSRMSITSPRA